MAILKCFSISNTQILASVVPNSSTSHSISKTSPSLPRLNTPSSQSTTPQKLQHPKNKHKNPNQPSISEIERAIGAGAFRDADIYRRSESNSLEAEWPGEKKLREVGEWLLETTENSSNSSSGKQILKVVFMWILPMWILSFLVAARIIELPFNSPFLDDLLL